MILVLEGDFEGRTFDSDGFNIAVLVVGARNDVGEGDFFDLVAGVGESRNQSKAKNSQEKDEKNRAKEVGIVRASRRRLGLGLLCHGDIITLFWAKDERRRYDMMEE